MGNIDTRWSRWYVPDSWQMTRDGHHSTTWYQSLWLYWMIVAWAKCFSIIENTLWLCQQFAIENGHLYWIYRWKMVIFHSFLYVYQRVYRQQKCSFVSKWGGQWHLKVKGFVETTLISHDISWLRMGRQSSLTTNKERGCNCKSLSLTKCKSSTTCQPSESLPMDDKCCNMYHGHLGCGCEGFLHLTMRKPQCICMTLCCRFQTWT